MALEVNHSSAQVQPQQVQQQKGQHATEKKKNVQYLPVGYFTFLTLVLGLNKKPSAECHGIKRVAEEGGLEEGHFWLKTSRVQNHKTSCKSVLFQNIEKHTMTKSGDCEKVNIGAQYNDEGMASSKHFFAIFPNHI